MNADACTVCSKSKTLLCKQCSSGRYCSKACQQADWPTHKLLCEAFGHFSASSRPSNEHFRAILFPIDSKKPKFFWLHRQWRDADHSRSRQPEAGQVESFLDPNAFPKQVPIQYNAVLKRKMPDTVYVCLRDTFPGDKAKTNTSIASIANTKPGQYPVWEGPVVAYGKVGRGIDQTAFKDLDMNDFRHIIDYFLSCPKPAIQQPIEKIIEGVKINCLGDKKILNKPKFEAFGISSTDPIFYNHDTSDIAKRIGLPIMTRRCPPDPRWANDQDNPIYEDYIHFNNQDATFLHLCCDPKAEFDAASGSLGWGWASQQWQNSVGSVVVMRQDKKPLATLHMEALCRYCRYEIRPLLGHSKGEYAPEEPMTRDSVLTMICRPTFVISWYKLLEKYSKEGKGLDAPFPYDVRWVRSMSYFRASN